MFTWAAIVLAWLAPGIMLFVWLYRISRRADDRANAPARIDPAATGLSQKYGATIEDHRPGAASTTEAEDDDPATSHQVAAVRAGRHP
jgi:hypothetical protein